MSEKINVDSGNPYRDQSGHFGTSPEDKLKASMEALRGKKLVSHEDNKKMVDSFKKEAEDKLSALRNGDNGDDSSSDIYHPKPAKAKLGDMTPAEKKSIQTALKYLSEKEVGDITISATKLGNRYGNASGKRVYVDSATIAQEHPIFIAGIIHHEAIHTRQASTMKPNMKETQARVQTKFWAGSKMSRANAAEKKALNKVIKES